MRHSKHKHTHIHTYIRTVFECAAACTWLVVPTLCWHLAPRRWVHEHTHAREDRWPRQANFAFSLIVGIVVLIVPQVQYVQQPKMIAVKAEFGNLEKKSEKNSTSLRPPTRQASQVLDSQHSRLFFCWRARSSKTSRAKSKGCGSSAVNQRH